MKNDYEICGEVTKIFVINKRNLKFEVLIDTEDLPRVLEVTGSMYCHCSDSTPYAIIHRKDKSDIKLHRFLMNPANHLVIDHLNHSGLDNRKKNLRICTQAENAARRTKGYRADWSHHPLKGVFF